MLTALTHIISPRINACELNFRPRLKIDIAAAENQHRRYCEAIGDLGAKVIELAVNRDYPDACFVEDTAVVLDEIAVMCSMGAVSRRGEVPGIADALRRHRTLARIAPPATLEGGDVLHLGKRLLVGLSTRTNRGGIDALAKSLEPFSYRVEAVHLRDCLHLKSACTALDHRTVLINPDWVDTGPFENCRIVPVAKDEPDAANVLRIDDSVIMPSRYPHTAEIIQELGWQVIPVDMTELIKAEAGVTCCSLLFEGTDKLDGSDA